MTIVSALKSMAVGGKETDVLFTPIKVGRLQLANRIVYAPLTRCRAFDNIPQPAAAEYYSQRAVKDSLMLTEATCISQQGQGYPCVPGIHSQEQVEAWKPVVAAVKGKGTPFFLQMWHTGRYSHPSFQPDGRVPISSSAESAVTESPVFDLKEQKFVPCPVPRAATKEEIAAVVQDYVTAAKNSLAAGFDGVEIHSANGYLLEQFLKDGINKRTDEYGGSIPNRCRFTLEVAKAVTDAIGCDRVGIRLSPYSGFLDASDSDPIALYTHLCTELDKLGLAYIHIVTARVAGNTEAKNVDLKAKSLKPYRDVFKGPIIAAGGFIKETAEDEINSGHADMICFGRWALANPDFQERIKSSLPLNKYDRDSFYIQDQVKGYTDYPYFKDIPKDAPTEKHYSGVTVFA